VQDAFGVQNVSNLQNFSRTKKKVFTHDAFGVQNVSNFLNFVSDQK
jgi:hypothetical protein